jgi:hypothetical protein
LGRLAGNERSENQRANFSANVPGSVCLHCNPEDLRRADEMSSTRRPAKICLILRDRLRGALVSAFRDGWQAKARSDREADFTAILKHWSKDIEGMVRILERGRE